MGRQLLAFHHKIPFLVPDHIILWTLSESPWLEAKTYKIDERELVIKMCRQCQQASKQMLSPARKQALVPKATADTLGTHAAVQGRGPFWSCWIAAAGVHRVHVEVR